MKYNVNKIISPVLKQTILHIESLGYSVRMVGGVVRDFLQNKKPKDIDFASDATPEQLIDIFNKIKIKTIPTGLQHGTITAIIDNQPIEFTTLRIDKNTDGRHAEVEFTHDWKLDAERRDLTYNAMSMDVRGNLYDYFGGQIDLKNQQTKFVGDSDKRIKEDYLRILRYFRFAGKNSSPISWDLDTLTSIKNNATGLNKISGERIWAELTKIVTGYNVKDIFEKMLACDVIKEIGFQNVYTTNIPETDNYLVKIAYIFQFNKNFSKTFLDKMKISSSEYEILKFLDDNKSVDITKNFIINSIMLPYGNQKELEKRKNLVYNLCIFGNKRSYASFIQNWNLPKFEITGGDLITQKNLKPGKEFGIALNKLYLSWIDSNFTKSKLELLSEI